MCIPRTRKTGGEILVVCVFRDLDFLLLLILLFFISGCFGLVSLLYNKVCSGRWKCLGRGAGEGRQEFRGSLPAGDRHLCAKDSQRQPADHDNPIKLWAGIPGKSWADLEVLALKWIPFSADDTGVLYGARVTCCRPSLPCCTNLLLILLRERFGKGLGNLKNHLRIQLNSFGSFSPGSVEVASSTLVSGKLKSSGDFSQEVGFSSSALLSCGGPGGSSVTFIDIFLKTFSSLRNI